jgi:hypothetical protein
MNQRQTKNRSRGQKNEASNQVASARVEQTSPVPLCAGHKAQVLHMGLSGRKKDLGTSPGANWLAGSGHHEENGIKQETRALHTGLRRIKI